MLSESEALLFSNVKSRFFGGFILSLTKGLRYVLTVRRTSESRDPFRPLANFPALR